MAKHFPQANVLGVDIVLPDVPESRRPSNCHFKLADVNKDMDTFEPIFDVVHWRLVETSTVDTDLFFYEAARILRPGGILIAVGANAVGNAPYSKAFFYQNGSLKLLLHSAPWIKREPSFL